MGEEWWGEHWVSVGPYVTFYIHLVGGGLRKLIRLEHRSQAGTQMC